MLGSFFYGYMCTQVLGGWLAARYGGKHVFGLGVLATSVLTLLTPAAARAGLPVLLAVRVLEGAFEGVTFPAFNQVLGLWVPRHQLTRFSTFVYAGALFGTIVSNPVSGWLCGLRPGSVPGCTFCTGWPAVFYLFGTMGLLWYAVWIVVFTSHPEHDISVTVAELTYIRSGQVDATPPPLRKYGRSIDGDGDGYGYGTVQVADGSEAEPLLAVPTPGLDIGPEPATLSRPGPPWLEFAGSGAVWSIVVANTVANWGFYNLLTCMPQYMKSVLGLDIATLGALSSLPYVCSFCAGIGIGQLADVARASGIRTVVVRKTLFALGLAVTSGGLLLLTYIPDLSNKSAIILLCFAMSGNGIGNGGWLVRLSALFCWVVLMPACSLQWCKALQW